MHRDTATWISLECPFVDRFPPRVGEFKMENKKTEFK